MKRILADIRSLFPSERRLFVTESLSWVALFLFFASLPLFTERHLLSYIPIAFGCLFALSAFLYMLFAKKLYFPVFFAFMLFFMVYAFALTCFTTKDWNSLKTMFSVLSLAAVVVEFLLLTGKPKWGLYAYAYSGIIFAIALLIDSIPTLPGRIGSTFGNINSIALYLSTWAVSFLALSLLGQSKKRFLYLIGAFIGLAMDSTRADMTQAVLEGVAFALPSEVVMDAARQIIETGAVHRGWLDILSVELNPQIAEYSGLTVSKGILVSQVVPGGEADRGGLRGGYEAVQYGQSIIYL